MIMKQPIPLCYHLNPQEIVGKGEGQQGVGNKRWKRIAKGNKSPTNKKRKNIHLWNDVHWQQEGAGRVEQDHKEVKAD